MDLEKRECPSCRRGFSCLPTSTAQYCSVFCETGGKRGSSFWGPKPVEKGTRKGLIFGDREKTVKEKSLNISPIKPLEKPSLREGEPTTAPISQESEPNPEDPTSETKPGLTCVAPTESTQPPSVNLQPNFERGALSSMRLLHKSANKLLILMDESVTPTDIEKSRSGDQRIESHKIQQAIDLANSLAHTIQVQANLLKATKMLMKE